jgi:hypothetical protein
MEVILLQEWRAAWQDVQIGKLGPESIRTCIDRNLEVILLQEWRAAWQDVQIGKL